MSFISITIDKTNTSVQLDPKMNKNSTQELKPTSVQEAYEKGTKELLGILNILNNGHEYYLSKRIMKKKSPWFEDISSYSATSEEAIRRFEVYHPKFCGLDCQLMRSSLGFWCGFVHLPRNYRDFNAVPGEVKIECYNQLVKTTDGVFGFYCNGKTDLIPVANAKNWKQLKRKQSYKRYPFVKKKVADLAQAFYQRQQDYMAKKHEDDYILDGLIVDDSEDNSSIDNLTQVKSAEHEEETQYLARDGTLEISEKKFAENPEELAQKSAILSAKNLETQVAKTMETQIAKTVEVQEQKTETQIAKTVEVQEQKTVEVREQKTETQIAKTVELQEEIIGLTERDL